MSDCLGAILQVAGILIIDTATDVSSLVRVLKAVEVDLILVDMATPDSYVLLGAATSADPLVGVIALGTSGDGEPEMIACAEAGVTGYHPRGASLSDLICLLRNAYGENSSVSSQVPSVRLRSSSARAVQSSEARGPALTRREIQVLRMLELGRSNRDIAARLDIAVHTVKNHVHSLLTKLGVSTRAEAAAVSRTLRL